MPASPIVKEMDALPDHWVHLQKTMIPDSTTSCYWSVWYDFDKTLKSEHNSKWDRNVDDFVGVDEHYGTAWLMWCPFGDDPSVNDSWGHAEEIDGTCKNVLTTIESVYGVSFHDSIWVEMGSGEVFPANRECC